MAQRDLADRRWSVHPSRRVARRRQSHDCDVRHPRGVVVSPLLVVDDENQKQVATQLFGRNVVFLGASLMLFAFFAAFGDDLPLMVTGPLFDLTD
jgi:hypothetical protein